MRKFSHFELFKFTLDVVYIGSMSYLFYFTIMTFIMYN